MIGQNTTYKKVFSWVYILLMLLFFFFLSGCNSTKRIQKLAHKHGEEISKTITLDTSIIISVLQYDTTIEKKIIKDTISFVYIDTNNIVLSDGTEIQIIDSLYFDHDILPRYLSRKTGIIINRSEKEIPIKFTNKYKQIVIKPPDKIDIILRDIKWIALSVLSFAAIIIGVKKILS